jgi:putative flippase GtrA
MSEFVRFFAVTVLGLIIDLAIAYALSAGLGVPLWLAAAAGFTLAATITYAIHQTWSFQTGPRGFSARRAALYGGTALATLAVRVAIVAVLDRILPDSLALPILICGAGGSFCVNFALSKFVVFAARPDGETP